jgi:hypothetical protein
MLRKNILQKPTNLQRQNLTSVQRQMYAGIYLLINHTIVTGGVININVYSGERQHTINCSQ